MSRMEMIVKGLKIGAATLVLAAVPAGFTTANGVQVDGLCADGTCCEERRSICNIGGGDNMDYYKKNSGKCGFL